MRHTQTATCMLVATALLAGCGGDDGDYANNPRPPAPINVTAAISDDRVTVSPQKFGAGPVVFIISNQTPEAQTVTLETSEIGGRNPGLKQSTSPINPMGTATLKVDMRQGTYEFRVATRGIRPAQLTVGKPRRSAQNELLQP